MLCFLVSGGSGLYTSQSSEEFQNVIAEAMYDYSLLALNVEILLELSLVIYQELKLWMIYLGLAGGIPITFLFLYIIVWESS